MSSSVTAAKINEVLKPFLFQVIGSTPESIRDSIKTSTLKSNPAPAALLAATCVFAAAVNKPTMENFISKPEMIDARPIISATFSLAGKPNMTGLTLLGHCVLTTKFADEIEFCVQFRKKMGQDNLWAGNLDSGSLSDKQKEILKKKKELTSVASARLLGSGFFKYSGIDSAGYTVEEADFWGERAAAPRSSPAGRSDAIPPPNLRPAASTYPPQAQFSYAGPSSAPSPAPKSSLGLRSRTDTTPPRAPAAPLARVPEIVNVDLGDNRFAQVPKDVAEYYLAVSDGDEGRMVESIKTRGVDNWVARYTEAMRDDPERRGAAGASVVG